MIKKQFESILDHAISCDISDIHLSAFCHPVYRVHGALREETQFESLTPDVLKQFRDYLLDYKSLDDPGQMQALDIAYTATCDERFRINIYSERSSICFAIRWLKGNFSSFTDLSLPEQIPKLADYNTGLVLGCRKAVFKLTYTSPYFGYHRH